MDSPLKVLYMNQTYGPIKKLINQFMKATLQMKN